MDATRDQPTLRSRWLAPLVVSVTGIALSVGFLPLLFNRVQVYDDEGALLLGLREFVRHGSLYHHSSGYYGPFYYSVFGALYRITGIDPTPFNGRILTLVLTGLAAGVFAAIVYRLTRSIAAAVLCEIASFLVLVKVAGSEPMHPASLILVLLGVVLYCLASNSLAPRNAHLLVAGVATTAIVLTKINVGMFLVIALAVWLLVGNKAVPFALRVLVVAGATVFPFLLTSQKFFDLWAATYALLIAVSILFVCAIASSSAPLPTAFKVVPFGVGAVATLLVSVLWPLLNGTSPGRLVSGMITRPLNQGHALTVPADIKLSWPWFVVAAIGVALALLWRSPRIGSNPIREEHWAIVLGVAGAAVLGLGSFGSFGAWLPAIVLLPALCCFIGSERVVLSLLVLTSAVAILQMLHAFPVAGSQTAWSTVAVFVPCSIAVGVALKWSDQWRGLQAWIRTTATVAVCAFLVVAVGYWPPGIWHDYTKNPKLGLPGTALMRLDPAVTEVRTDAIQAVTAFLTQNCDTFYSAPPSDSFYIYTKIPTPTGLTIDWYGVLDTNEQTEIVNALESAVQQGKRVCILRESTGYDQWAASTTGRGPLGREVLSFGNQITGIGTYTVLTRG